MASTQSSSTLPQGFSVYQPTLGAPLQFFPALGSQQLDDMINAFIPGPSAASEKRATISLDFLEYAQMTGQTFKFYPVQSAPSAAASPSTASPSLDSVNSSFNVSPVTSSWDWSAASAPSVASSSRGSTQRRRQSKTSSPPSRHQTTDFSHLPGMKILTKDGLDVTNSASRGSKTKEQRDHAHLMRIIKACDSCKRKKIRCDPSHKKRGAAQVTTPQPTPKPAKKARTIAQDPPPCPLPATITDTELLFSASSFDLDSSFDFSGLENLDPATIPYDPFDEFVQFPAMDTPDFDFLLDTGDYLSSQSTTTASSSSAASPLKALTPSSTQEPGAPPGTEFVNPELQERSPNFPFLERSGSSSDYTDFNLYSPQSSFSEDERMLPIGSSTGSLPSLNEPSLSECPPPSYESMAHGEAIEWDGPGLSVDELQFHSANESVGGSGRSPLSSSGMFATTSFTRTAGDPVDEFSSPPNRSPGVQPPSQVVICCPPGTVVVAGDTSPGGQALDSVSTSFNSSVASASVEIDASESPGVFVDQSISNLAADASNRISSVLPADYVGLSTNVSTIRNSSESTAESARQSVFVSTNRMDSESPGTTAIRDQDHVASAISPASSYPEPNVLSASSTGDGLQVSTNRSAESIDNSTSSSTHDLLIGGFERPVHEASPVISGTSDHTVPDVVISDLEGAYNDELRPSAPMCAAQSSEASSTPVPVEVSLREQDLSVPDVPGERYVVSHRSIPTASPFSDQDERPYDIANSNDQGVSVGLSTSGEAETQPSQASSNALPVIQPPINATIRSLATIQPHGSIEQSRSQSADSSVSNTEVDPVLLAHTATMSNLALYMLAAMIATNGDMNATPQPSSAVASCRTASRASLHKRRTVFSTMSPLCVV
ncbi:transcription factor Cys6 [Pochonia chlamydosporia 170]|uniref:Transcription factor Cys6 n=1 Tax=Pochonia chlamydosporia 170 TaxID=1380566 RepID=A0A179F523_METCM|nr:transcription factor Cys6 [Pochonia chlamydosporia 170]OAQ60528.1 transcription factor Cys6 [Pochonia chlamydosporia 170]